MSIKILQSILISISFCAILNAQPRKELVQVVVAPNHADWNYDIGDRAEFNITVLQNNVPLENVSIDYTIQIDAGFQFIKILKEGQLKLKNGSVKVKRNHIMKLDLLDVPQPF